MKLLTTRRRRRGSGTHPVCSSLLLVVVGEHYRAPPRLDTAELRAAYDQGVRDATADDRASGRTLSFDRLDRLAALDRDAQRAYWLGARRNPLQAPPSPAVEAALLALEATAIVYASDVRDIRRAVAKTPGLVSLALITNASRIRAQQRRARRLGLGADTAPQPMITPRLLQALTILACRVYRWRGSGIVDRADWPTLLAHALVVRYTARRSWQRARRCAQ